MQTRQMSEIYNSEAFDSKSLAYEVHVLVGYLFRQIAEK